MGEKKTLSEDEKHEIVQRLAKDMKYYYRDYYRDYWTAKGLWISQSTEELDQINSQNN